MVVSFVPDRSCIIFAALAMNKNPLLFGSARVFHGVALAVSLEIIVTWELRRICIRCLST